MDGVLVAFAALLCGGLEIWLCWAGSQRRLAPGGLLGVHLGVVRRSESTWYAAHEAAAGPFGVGGGVASACGLAILVNGLDVFGVVLAGVAAVAIVAGAATATVAARRAALEL